MAVLFEWISGTFFGDFSDPAQWTPTGGPPGAGDIALPDYALPSVTKHLVASQEFCVVSGGCVDGSE